MPENNEQTVNERLSVSTLRQRMYTLLTGALDRFYGDSRQFGVPDAEVITEVINVMHSTVVKVKAVLVFTLPRQHNYDEFVYLPVEQFNYHRLTKAIDVATEYLSKPDTSIYVHLVGEDDREYQIRAIEYNLHRRHYMTSETPKCSANFNITIEVEKATGYTDLPIEDQ